MSDFYCERCGTPCYDTPLGYSTGCVHYPADFRMEFCLSCNVEIVADDDPGLTCTDCGGKNRKVYDE